jgi:signal recognition particle receptor subunit beta
MPLVNHSRHEVHLKIVYYGAGLGGKTTNLEYIHGHTRPQNRGKLISLMTETERTLFFDLLPVDLGAFKGYRVRVHLCTVPGQIAHDETRRLVLRHVDGVVFVVDSQDGRQSENVESIKNLDANLRLQGDDPDRIPLVVQFNKRDLDNALPVAELVEQLNIPDEVPYLEASALHGGGVFETLKLIIKRCLALVGDPRKADEGRSPSILPGRRASMIPGAVPPAAGESREIPKAPRMPRFDGED